MIRRLLWIALAALVVWLVRRLGQRVRGRPAGGTAPLSPRFEGAMVRDRECQTFLPRARALSVRGDEGERFFCSTACREAFLARTRPVSR